MFAELMLGWGLRSYRTALAMNGCVLVDRRIPDIIGYLPLCDLPVPTHIQMAENLYPYNEQDFLGSYWDTIFVQDAERKQGRQKAKVTGKVMVETYTRLCNQLTELPSVVIKERADVVVDCLKSVRRIRLRPVNSPFGKCCANHEWPVFTPHSSTKI
ncbi:hypothetical protein ROA7450_04145 [Roseovarius albus]|uniref:NadR/Ttd14 AAA domain-containing protein n=1 Tax=Roseovarius albus TaxID=1247867 RepID=A0A1X7A9B8_9RHOB|nr:AAA family ATPase [Roseovarius albus]SLN73510.1 hypothetical protein ROA7450_04145 [Roseovarius albus]